MKPSAKIIKRKRDEDSRELKTLETDKSLKINTRDLARTVKAWINESQQRRSQNHSFAPLPVSIALASQNT